MKRFVVLMYDRGSDQMTVNGARKQFLKRKDRAIGNITPTKSASIQHIKDISGVNVSFSHPNCQNQVNGDG